MRCAEHSDPDGKYVHHMDCSDCVASLYSKAMEVVQRERDDALAACAVWERELTSLHDAITAAMDKNVAPIICGYCHHPMELRPSDMRPHVQMCAKNPLVQERDMLRAEIERLTSERDALRSAMESNISEAIKTANYATGVTRQRTVERDMLSDELESVREVLKGYKDSQLGGDGGLAAAVMAQNETLRGLVREALPYTERGVHQVKRFLRCETLTDVCERMRAAVEGVKKSERRGYTHILRET